MKIYRDTTDEFFRYSIVRSENLRMQYWMAVVQHEKLWICVIMTTKRVVDAYNDDDSPYGL